MRRDPRRWSTRFGRWSSSYGVSRMAADISSRAPFPVTASAVFKWIAGHHVPREYYMTQIIELSDGVVQQHDVLEHQRKLTGR